MGLTKSEMDELRWNVQTERTVDANAVRKLLEMYDAAMVEVEEIRLAMLNSRPGAVRQNY